MITLFWWTLLSEILGCILLCFLDISFSALALLVGDRNSTTTSSLAPIKSRMETFWYRLTQVHLENTWKMALKRRERGEECVCFLDNATYVLCTDLVAWCYAAHLVPWSLKHCATPSLSKPRKLN